jgi:hypothetical protein
MKLRRQCILICAALALTLPVVRASAADNSQFKPEAIDSYSNAQKVSGLMLAADSYHDEDRAQTAFGKRAKPYDNGVLPVLLMIRNDSNKTINLQQIRVEYHADRARSTAIPARDVPLVKDMGRPRATASPIPGRVSVRRGRNPLDAQEIQDRAFAAPMLPPGEVAWGFFYFQALYRENAILYITGLTEAGTGNELFFMEVPVNNGVR